MKRYKFFLNLETLNQDWNRHTKKIRLVMQKLGTFNKKKLPKLLK